MTAKTKTRKLQCIAAWDNIGPVSFWRLVAQCNQCGRVNYHSGGCGKKPDAGHRAAHCVCRDGYELVVVITIKDNEMKTMSKINGRSFGKNLSSW